MTNEELMRRADLAIADLQANGGMLNPDQANTFIDMIKDEPTIIQDVRVETMNAPTKKINRIGFANRIMRAARQGTPPYMADDGTNDRYLPAAERSAVTTGQIELNSKEVMAEVHLTYETLEDNIERGNLEEHIMRLISEQVARDLEEWMLMADTASGDAYFALNDGLLKTATKHVVDLSAQVDIDGGNLNSQVHPDTFTNGMLAMPQKYLRDLNRLRHYLTVADVTKYRSRVARRQTGYGDTALVQNNNLSVHGIQVEQAPLMPVGFGLFTFPKNIIFGIQRNISVETDRDIRAREYIIVLTMRIDCIFDDDDAVVKYINVGQ
jgi:HK97 family phage major capsid protein